MKNTFRVLLLVLLLCPAAMVQAYPLCSTGTGSVPEHDSGNSFNLADQESTASDDGVIVVDVIFQLAPNSNIIIVDVILQLTPTGGPTVTEIYWGDTQANQPQAIAGVPQAPLSHTYPGPGTYQLTVKVIPNAKEPGIYETVSRSVVIPSGSAYR